MHPYPSHGDATRPVPFYRVGTLYDVFWDRATIIYPGAGGGSDWCHSSFNPATGWIYVPYGLVSSSYSNTREGRVNTSRPLGEYMAGGMAAVDPRTNRVVWRRDHGYSICHGNGILTTDGGVMFQGWPDGAMHAFDELLNKRGA